MTERLANIRIVLVGTTHPGNIGASARAMKCMGLSALYLVQPPAGFPGAEATARAAGADDLLAQAVVCESLAAAIADCGLVVGTSARERSIPWPVLEPDACAREALKAATEAPVAILFGRERSGLTNEEIDRCNAVVNIPTRPGFSSLNLAAAVQVIAYELWRAALAESPPARPEAEPVPPATSEQLEQLHQHLERTMIRAGFFDPGKPRRLPRRLRRLFNRARLDQNELNILRGFLAAVEEKMPPE